MPTPSEQLAQRTVRVLVEKGLIDPSDAEKLVAQLASGRITQDDWRLFVETAPEKARRR